MRIGQPQCAADSLSAVLGDRPASASPLLWLLAGRASITCGEAAAADAALTEANLLDSELPEPWGWLGLLAAR